MTAIIHREEHDAKLERILAEMRLDTQTQVQAMRAETQTQMQAMRVETQAIREETQVLSGKIDKIAMALEVQAAQHSAAFSALNARIDGVEKGLEGKIDGIKSSLTMLQWLFGIVAAVAAIWIGYLQLKQATVVPATEIINQSVRMPDDRSRP